MSIVLVGSTSGSITLQEPAVAGTTVLDLPAVSGTILTTGSSGQSIPKAALPTGSVLQVVSTTKSDTFSSSAINTWTDITGLTVSITPTSSSSKILITASVQGSNTSTNAYFRLVRNSTAVGVGDASGSRSQVSSANIFNSGGNEMSGSSFQFLDSPSTTSSTTYKIQFITDGVTTLINRTSNDVDALYTGRSQSTITVMEIAA
jgi:hypothetical protein